MDEIAEHLDKLLPDFEIKSWILAMEVGPGVPITSFDQYLEPLFDNNGVGHLAVKVNPSFKGMACRISFLSVGSTLA